VFTIRPSSYFSLAPRQPAAVSTPLPAPEEEVQLEALEEPAEPFIDRGLPIPESYEVDVIRALLQDPFRVFIYWQVQDESLKTLTRYFSAEDVADFRTTLKLFDVGGRHTAYFDVGHRGRYWMMVFPDREYEFEIGVYSALHGYIALVRSNRVRTPRGTISPEAPADDGYRMSPSQFVQVLDASGFGTRQSLDLTVSAMPGLQTSIEPLEHALSLMPPSVRDAVLLSAGGRPLTREVIEVLPERLRLALLELLRADGGRLAGAGLMHYLPEILRDAIDDERDLIAGQTHPVHFAPRFFASGSENVSWPRDTFCLPGGRSSADLVR
jgi:hypothetical protein